MAASARVHTDEVLKLVDSLLANDLAALEAQLATLRAERDAEKARAEALTVERDALTSAISGPCVLGHCGLCSACGICSGCSTETYNNLGTVQSRAAAAEARAISAENADPCTKCRKAADASVMSRVTAYIEEHERQCKASEEMLRAAEARGERLAEAALGLATWRWPCLHCDGFATHGKFDAAFGIGAPKLCASCVTTLPEEEWRPVDLGVYDRHTRAALAEAGEAPR